MQTTRTEGLVVNTSIFKDQTEDFSIIEGYLRLCDKLQNPPVVIDHRTGEKIVFPRVKTFNGETIEKPKKKSGTPAWQDIVIVPNKDHVIRLTPEEILSLAEDGMVIADGAPVEIVTDSDSEVADNLPLRRNMRNPFAEKPSFTNHGFAVETIATAKETDYIVHSDVSILAIGKQKGNSLVQNSAKILRTILSLAAALPLEKLSMTEHVVLLIGGMLNRYIPEQDVVNKMLAASPELNAMAKDMSKFAAHMKQAGRILDERKMEGMDEAIDELIKALDFIRKVDLDAMSKASKSTIIDINPTSTDDDDKDKKGKKPKEKKPEAKPEQPAKQEKDPKPAESQQSDPNPQAAAFGKPAQPQVMMPPDLSGRSVPLPLQPMEDNGLPVWCDLNLSNPTKTAPEWMQQEPKPQPVSVEQRLFQPVEQQPAPTEDMMTKVCPFISDIKAIANSLGFMVNFAPIMEYTKTKIIGVYVTTYGNPQPGMEYPSLVKEKSFVIDLGSAIDNRIGIWPCANDDAVIPNSIESCDIAFAMKTRDGKFNAEFFKELFKVGFGGLKEDFKKAHTLYSGQMLVTNRVVDLMSIPSGKNIDSKFRNAVKGACIRMSSELEKMNNEHGGMIGRFRVESFDQKAYSFKLTNQGVSQRFGAPPVNFPQMVTITATPALDENGKHIPVREGRSDIKYDLVIAGLK